MDSSITAYGVITPRERQRRDFFDGLSFELEKIAATTDSVNASLRDSAEEHFAKGAEAEVCIDLLILDGFSSRSARNYVETRVKAASFQEEETEGSTYDFMFRDHRGRLIRGSEIGRSVKANDDEQALHIASKIMSEVEPPVEVIEVHKLR